MPEDFASENTNETTKKDNTMNTKKLRRSRTDRSIAGVCAGLANYLGVDTTLLRILTICLVIFGGMSLWVYIILWLLIPEEEI
jgi:phage shock protein PspC (stress-responsive transcriptional regulator)